MDHRESTRTIRIDLRKRRDVAAPRTQPGIWSVEEPRDTAVSQEDATGRTPDYSRLIESIYDGVLIADLDGTIIEFNRRGLDFFRCEGDELAGKSLLDVISGAENSLLASIHRNLEEHRYTLIEGRCIRRDQTVFPAEIAVNRLRLNGADLLCVLIRDITVRCKAQEALEDAVTRLEAHDRARLQFVSNVSHELKTPLTSMIYAVNNMLSGVVGPVPERVRRYLEILSGDCKRLLSTVNDILDLRKIETKTLTLEKSRVPFSRLVRQSVQSLLVQAREKGVRLKMRSDTFSWFVECDAAKMERVILNIVGNAIKFTPAGGAIEVTVTGDPDNRDRVLLSVRDTGIGIPPEAIDKVTVQYFTVGEQPSGSGLGLAIAKEIVALHGGNLEISSPPPGHEAGTVAAITLPTVQPPSVLLVDDDPAVLQVLADQVKRQGYRYVTAADGVDALDKITSLHPDAVVLDLILPEMDGTELILKMMSSKALMRIPVVVITAAHLGRAKAEILTSFSIPALGKPWDEDELFDTLAEAFMGSATLRRKTASKGRK